MSVTKSYTLNHFCLPHTFGMHTHTHTHARTHTHTHSHTHTHTHTHVQVYEETGLDIRDLIKEDQFLEAKVGDNLTRMYIIPGVQDSTPFAPKTRKEIRVRGSGKRGEGEGVREGGKGNQGGGVWPEPAKHTCSHLCNCIHISTPPSGHPVVQD